MTIWGGVGDHFGRLGGPGRVLEGSSGSHFGRWIPKRTQRAILDDFGCILKRFGVHIGWFGINFGGSRSNFRILLVYCEFHKVKSEFERKHVNHLECLPKC